MMEQQASYRLAPQQKRIWSWREHAAQQRSHCVVRLTGPVDAGALRRALERVVAAEEILRTVFRKLPGMKLPSQMVLPTVTLEWHEEEEAAEGARSGFDTRHRSLDFDFDNGPLLAAHRLRLGEQEELLLLTLPCLVADLCSLRHLVQRLGDAYRAETEGRTALQPAASYIKFSEFQLSLLGDEDAEEGRNFWNKRQADEAVRLAERLGGGDDVARGVVHCPLELPGQIATKVSSLAEELETDTSTVLLAAWQAFLFRLTGTPGRALGVVLPGRDYEPFEHAIGPFARCLPMPLQCGPDSSLRRLVEILDDELEEMIAWQEYFDPEGELATAHCPVAFDFDECMEAFEAAGVRFSINSHFSSLEPGQLKLCGRASENSLALFLAHDPAELATESALRLGGYFSDLLTALVEEPNRPLSTFELVQGSERLERLEVLNDTEVDYGPECPIHALFEQQAASRPLAVAVRHGEESLDYGELNRRANQLAHHLRALGVSPESLVGLCLDRSLEMVVALLAVLKAGGAYVPLDPNLPEDRLAHMVDAVAPRVLLSRAALASQLHRSGREVVLMDDDWSVISQCPDSDPASGVVVENLAYVLFTSGSTGRPKGVAIEHRQLFNYVQGVVDRLQPLPDATLAMVSTFAADLGNTMLFPALTTGRCLYVALEEETSDPERFATRFTHSSVDAMKIVPSHLKALLAASDAGQVLPRDLLVLGGEKLEWRLVEELAQRAPGCRIFNHYGPTETTVGFTACRVDCGVAERSAATVPLGRPLPNCRVYLLDASLKLVPAEVPGEICLAGAGLGRGYSGEPRATAERFIPDPHAPLPGGRLYCSGDLARYLPDGEIEFVGRIDHQIKIRGFRVELGEVETVVAEHPAVREAVVTALFDDSDSPQLTAYLVFKPQQSSGVEELRTFLRRQLPGHMIPSRFVPLKALPLTPNGKVDRGALPAAEEADQLAGQRPFVAPRTAVEELLADIWREILKVERVGVDDDFFDLGGHSLLAMQVLSRVRETFQTELELRTFFETSTIAGLGEGLKALETEAGRLERIAATWLQIQDMDDADVEQALEKDHQEEVTTS